MNYIFYQLTRGIGVFFRTLRAFFTRRIMGLGAQLRRLTNFSRHATKVASSSLQGVMSAAQKPTSPSDYVETGRLYISKALIIRVLLVIVALVLLVYFVVWPFILSRFLTARFFEEDKRVKDWSGRVIVYSDKKKTLPLYSGRLEDGVLQGECKQYDREGVLLFEGQLRDGVPMGSGKEYTDGVLAYEGQYADGLYSGRGKRYEDGQLVYVGQYDAGMRSGSGTAYEDGTLLYDGQFMDDLYEGRGKLYRDGALYYDGSFHAGAAEGTGTVYRDGRLVYEGMFQNDLYEGRGKLYENGSLRYDGSFHVGLPEGSGTAYHANGRVSYQGQYLAGKPDGYGVVYGEDGRKSYDGSFADGIYSGTGTLFFSDGSQLDAEFQNGEAAGTVEWKKNGILYYQGEWSEDGPSGFGTLYSKAGKKLYEGPFLGGTLDGRKLLAYTPDELRSAFCESSVKSETIDDGYRIIVEELGVAALCTFQTEKKESTVYQIYLSAPEKGDWVAILPGMAHTQAVQWPGDAEPVQRTIRYREQYGVNLAAGTYFAENALSDIRRTTALYSDETRTDVVLLTWVRTDVTPVPLEMEESGDGAGSVEAFLSALDGMDASGAGMNEGAAFGDRDPAEVLAEAENAAQAVEQADAMLAYWAIAERMSALKEALGRMDILLADARDDAAKGMENGDRVKALEQAELELGSQIEACLTELKRAEMQAEDAGLRGLEDCDLGKLPLEFDPAEQKVDDLTLIAVAYAQATGREVNPEMIRSEVKIGLLDMTDAYGKVKLALARYQNLTENTKNEAGAYAMGLGSKETWYDAMNEQTLGRIELCDALAEFTRLANRFNQLTGGWVSRTFDWQREALEPLFLAEVLPAEVFALAASGYAGKAAASASEAAEAAEAAALAAGNAEDVRIEPYNLEETEAAISAAALAAEKAEEAAAEAEKALQAAERASGTGDSAAAAAAAQEAKAAAEAAAKAAGEGNAARKAAEEAAEKAAEIALQVAAMRDAAAAGAKLG